MRGLLVTRFINSRYVCSSIVIISISDVLNGMYHIHQTLWRTMKSIAVFVLFLSNPVMVSAFDDVSFEHKVQQLDDDGTQKLFFYEECSFALSRLRGNIVETRSMDCPEDFVCVENSLSSLGGHCVSINQKQRNIQTICNKCEPFSACAGLSADFIANKISDGSCCGDAACVGVDEGEAICTKFSIVL